MSQSTSRYPHEPERLPQSPSDSPKSEREASSPSEPIIDTSLSTTHVGEGLLDPIPASTDKTVISQQPVAGPEEFFHSLPIVEMARILVGKQLDHFVLDELVGGGGMGAVFRGRDLRLERVVAIKVIPAAKRDAETLRRFRVEAQSAARLDHPNIARVYYVGEAEQWSYIVFEFIEGTNLRDLVHLHGPMSVDDSVCIIRQVAEALDHARSRDVVHRDIKPSNILITAQGQAKIVDMGLARSNELDKSSHDVTASGVTLGTFDYISPEQARDPRDADVRSDLYSLGCTWYFLLVARPPFPDGTALQKLLKHGSEKPEDPRYFRSDLSGDLVAILFKMMAKKPSDRYQQPLDLVADLQLLARIEDLPKSQQAGTMVLPPVVTPRSFVDATLPWFLAFGVVLGSTLWLQSMDRWRADYALPMADLDPIIATPPQTPVPANTVSKNTEGLETSARPEGNKSTSPSDSSRIASSSESSTLEGSDSSKQGLDNGTKTGEKAIARSHVIHVRPSTSESAPSDGGVVVTSLDEAVHLAELDTHVSEIWLEAPIVSSASIKIPRRGLTIRAAPGTQTVLEWNPSPSSEKRADKTTSWFDVGDHELTLKDVHLFANLTGDRSGIGPKGFSVFRIAPSAKLELSDSMITCRSGQNNSNHSIFLGDATSRRTSEPTDSAQSTSLPISPLQLRLENVIIRGETKWLSMPDAFRTEVRWVNGLLAIDERMIDLSGSSLSTKTPVNLRLTLDHVTVACKQGFARITLDAMHPHRVRITRESSDCAYWAQREQSWIEVFGVDKLDDINDMLDLRGEDNAYDTNVETFVAVSNKEGDSERYHIEDAPSDILRERGMEGSIRWQESINTAGPFSTHLPSNYRQMLGDFQPGMLEWKLPKFDPRSL